MLDINIFSLFQTQLVPGNFGDNFKNFDIITTPKLQ